MATCSPIEFYAVQVNASGPIQFYEMQVPGVLAAVSATDSPNTR